MSRTQGSPEPARSLDPLHTFGTLFTPDDQRADTRQWRKCRPLLAFHECPARDSNPEPTD